MESNKQMKVLEEILAECEEESEIEFKYQDIANAFSGGPNPRTFECDKIATVYFKEWANQRGWEPSFDLTQEHNLLPNVILTRIK